MWLTEPPVIPMPANDGEPLHYKYTKVKTTSYLKLQPQLVQLLLSKKEVQMKANSSRLAQLEFKTKSTEKLKIK